MPYEAGSHNGRRLNPLFPLAAEPNDKKDFQPLQAVQRFVSDVRSKFDKPKPKSDTAKALDAVAAATKPNQSQSQKETRARDLITSLSSKGFVLAKTQPVDHEAAKVTNPAAIITKEELGRATWVFLHTLAVQYPKSPTKQQKKDVKNLVDVMTRMYPCTECAKHFGDIVKNDPPAVGSGRELQQWMCRVHNVVNKSIGKRNFNCKFVDARWGELDCGEEYACKMEGTPPPKPKK